MSVIDFMYRFGVFRRLLRLDRVAEKAMQEQSRVRQNLEERLERVTRATLNGETEWFLRLVKKDPDCAMDVIKECKLNDD